MEIESPLTTIKLVSTCSYKHHKVKESYHKDQSKSKFKERFYVTKVNLQSKDRNIKFKEWELKCMKIKDKRRMSMLERRITTRD